MSEFQVAGPLPAEPAPVERRQPYELVPGPDKVPLYELVPVQGPRGQVLDGYRGVQRMDSQEVVSIVSSRYGLVQHADIARSVHELGAALEVPQPEADAPPFRREEIRLYSGGRRMEVKLVVGTRYDIAPGESLFPAVRVTNSLDGSWAVRCEGLGVRIACANQVYAGMGSLVELRELHLSSATDLLGQLKRAIHVILARFRGATAVYARSMGQEILACDVEPALLNHGLPKVHAEIIGTRAEVLASHNGTLSRWTAYNLATGCGAYYSSLSDS
jgi:hypothetical protein